MRHRIPLGGWQIVFPTEIPSGCYLEFDGTKNG